MPLCWYSYNNVFGSFPPVQLKSYWSSPSFPLFFITLFLSILFVPSLQLNPLGSYREYIKPILTPVYTTIPYHLTSLNSRRLYESHQDVLNRCGGNWCDGHRLYGTCTHYIQSTCMRIVTHDYASPKNST